MNSILLFDGASKNDSSDWKVINDGVMGGVSESRFFLNSNSNACFQGTVSLENNGGFCSVQCQFKTIVLKQEHYFSLLLKGDGKKYQFRIKRQASDNHSYCYEFQTSTNWETIQIPFDQMHPAFRGKKLDLPNFDGSQLEQIAFLIGNKESEYFELCIQTIRII